MVTLSVIFIYFSFNLVENFTVTQPHLYHHCGKFNGERLYSPFLLYVSIFDVNTIADMVPLRPLLFQLSQLLNLTQNSD